MSAHMKYIMVEDRYGDKSPILFAPSESHANMAFKLNAKVSSAGFVINNLGTVECYGESTSLGVKSDPEDTKILQRYLSPNT